MNNPIQMLMQFPQFMNQFRGQNPETIINNLISSGRVNQAQLNHAQQTAQQIQGQLEQFKGMFGFK